MRAIPIEGVAERRLDFEAEADRLRCGALKDFWYVACLSSELGRKKPLARTILGTPLVLFRAERDVAVALLDRCLHRNARLSCGELFNGKLSCPYHGWTYNETGACVAVPSLGGGRTPHSDVGRVESFTVREQDGLVFVFMGDNGALGRTEPFRMPHYGEDSWTEYKMVTSFPSGATQLVENFMDVPHTAFVHRGWFRRQGMKKLEARVERRDGSVCVTYYEGEDALAGLGRIFNRGRLPMHHTDRFFIPHVTRVDYSWGKAGFSITSQCTPVGAFESEVYTSISYRLPLDVPRALVARALRPLIRWYTRQVIAQDVRIMGIQRDGLRVSRGGDFKNTDADLLHTHVEAYRAWLLVGATGPGPNNQDDRITLWI